MKKRTATLGCCVILALAAPAVILGLRAHRRAEEQRRLHSWVVTVAFENGASRTLALDLRRPDGELADALHQAILPMFSDTTPPSKGCRVLGSVAAKYSYQTDNEENEMVARARSAARKRYDADAVATFCYTVEVPTHKVLLTADGECHLATDMEIERGPEYHRARIPDASIAPDYIAGILTRHIRLAHAPPPSCLQNE